MIADQFLAVVRTETVESQTKRNRHGLRARIDAIFRGHRIEVMVKRVVLHAALQ